MQKLIFLSLLFSFSALAHNDAPPVVNGRAVVGEKISNFCSELVNKATERIPQSTVTIRASLLNGPHGEVARKVENFHGAIQRIKRQYEGYLTDPERMEKTKDFCNYQTYITVQRHDREHPTAAQEAVHHANPEIKSEEAIFATLASLEEGRGNKRAVEPEADPSVQTFVNKIGNSLDECIVNGVCVTPDKAPYEDLTEDFSGISSVLTGPVVFTKCPCLSDRVQQATRMKPGSGMNLMKAAGKIKLTNKIFDAFATRFMNDYAAQVEDVNFFGARVSEFFGDKNNKRAQEEKAEFYQCSQYGRYDTAIESYCGLKLSPEEKEKKLDRIFGIFGKNEQGSSLQKKFATINQSISTLDQTTKNKEGELYSRRDHDNVRYGYSLSKPEFKFADKLISKALSERVLRKDVLESSRLPADVISEEMQKKALNNPEDFISKYLDKGLLGETYYNSLAASIRAKDGSKNIFKEILNYSMEIHPGFSAILRDKELLRRANEKARKDKSSLKVALEKDDEILGPKFQADCDKLIQDVAQAVCTNDEDLIKSLPPSEINKLMADESENDKLVAKLIACEAEAGAAGTPGFLTNINMDFQETKHSDFLDRMTGDPTNPKNMFALFAKELANGNKTVIADVAHTIQNTYAQGSSIESNNLASSVGSTSESFNELIGFDASKGVSDRYATPQTANFSSKEVPSSQQDSSSMSMANPQASIPSQDVPAYSNMSAFTANAAATTDDAKTAQMRREMREFLSNEENKEQVEKLVNTTDPKVLEEIAKLKEEAAKSKEKLLQLIQENERLKLASVQKDIKSLEEKRAQKITEAVSPKNSQQNEREQKSSGVKRDIASIQDVGGSSSGQLNSSGSQAGSSGSESASASSGSSSAAGSVSGKSGNASNALNAIAAAASQSEPIILSSTATRTPGIEVRSNELSMELLTYLEKNEPDIQTLIKIRNSGMVYKYKVVENGKLIEKEMVVNYNNLNEDVKKLIDQKIADSGLAGVEISRLNSEIKSMNRTYSYSALKSILADKLKR